MDVRERDARQEVSSERPGEITLREESQATGGTLSFGPFL